MKTPNEQTDPTTNDWPFPADTQAPPEMDWEAFLVIGFVLVAFVCVIGSALW